MSDDDPPDGFMTRVDCLREMSKLSGQLEKMDDRWTASWRQIDGKLNTIIELKVKVENLEKKDNQSEQDKRENRREISGWKLVAFGTVLGSVLGFIFSIIAKFIP